MAKRDIKVGIHEGSGQPPYRWSVHVLEVAFKEAHGFLDEDQYQHASEQIKELAREPDPSHSLTQSVDAIEDFFELRDKGGILGKINLRVFFCLNPEHSVLLVLGAINRKQNDGPTPQVDKIRMRNRRREISRRGEFEGREPAIGCDTPSHEGVERIRSPMKDMIENPSLEVGRLIEDLGHHGDIHHCRPNSTPGEMTTEMTCLNWCGNSRKRKARKIARKHLPGDPRDLGGWDVEMRQPIDQVGEFNPGPKLRTGIDFVSEKVRAAREAAGLTQDRNSARPGA